MRYEFAGPRRMEHQRRGLRRMIETKGVLALLHEPGVGKTATTLDYMGLLTLKKGTETRVLVVAPLAAIDTWAIQAETWLSPQINFWAEALGGSVKEKAWALAARGGNPFRDMPSSKREATSGRFISKAVHFTQRGLTTSRRGGPAALAKDKPRLIITVVNLDAFGQRQRYKSGTMADLMLEAVKRYSPDLVVVDESHKIKSATSNVSRLLGRIGAIVPRRVMLTGTVLPHSPLDAFGQWRFLEPTAFGTVQRDGSRKRATFDGFKDRYAQLGGYMGREVTGFKNLDELQAIMAKNSDVALKKDAMDLPPVRPVIVPVHLSPREAKAYAEMKKALAVQLAPGGSLASTSSAPNRLTQMMRLRQITAGHIPDDNGQVQEIGTSKADVIKSIVHDTLAGEKRVVVFAVFRHEIASLRKKLDQSGTEVMIITGGTDSKERLRLRKRFGDLKAAPGRIVLIAQIKTISLAVNELVTASHAVFGSLSLQRDDLIQAQDRLNRMGQEKRMTFWFALAKGTVDEVIYQTHQKRTSLEAAVLKHILVPDESDDTDSR